MKRITAIALLTVASLFTAGGALAQNYGVQASVPFDFIVGGKTLPHGTYIITSPAYGVVMIQDRDKRTSVLNTASPDNRELKDGGKLVFNKYGDQYFLREVLCEDASISVMLPRSKQEKRVMLQEAAVHNGAEILVAAR